MSEKKVIHSDQAPVAIGPYSQAIVYNGMVYCSGQIAIDPQNGKIVGEGVKEQTEQVLKNLDAVLRASGSSLNKVVKCTIFMVDMADFSVVNAIYGNYFTENPPARETVAVKTLPKNVLVEISCIAGL